MFWGFFRRIPLGVYAVFSDTKAFQLFYHILADDSKRKTTFFAFTIYFFCIFSLYKNSTTFVSPFFCIFRIVKCTETRGKLYKLHIPLNHVSQNKEELYERFWLWREYLPLDFDYPTLLL